MSYIIEHPTKGILMEVPGDRDEKHHWSWSKLRSEALQFPNFPRAQEAFGTLTPEDQDKSSILDASIGYKVVRAPGRNPVPRPR